MNAGKIPVSTAKFVAKKHGLKQCLLIGWDGEQVHVVTYGRTKADCEAAARAQDFWTGHIREFSFRPHRERNHELTRPMQGKMQRNAILRQGSPVDDLMAFVQSEIGRTADERLEDSCSLILYFQTEADRLEFKELVMEAKPGMMAKTIP